MKFRVEVDQETDGRWLAEVMELPGVMSYGITQEEAKLRVQALASNMRLSGIRGVAATQRSQHHMDHVKGCKGILRSECRYGKTDAEMTMTGYRLRHDVN